MKIIKKIAAIMLSVMMVLGMCSVVGAEGAGATSGTGTSGIKGSITINKAAPGETYKIYRILDLESYSGSGETGNYAYKLRNDKVAGSKNSWSDFINSSGINGEYVTLAGDYVTWKGTADAAQFAKLALKYAKDNTTKIVEDQTETAPAAPSGATTSTVSFSGLPLGYYLVETSVGTVIALNTTNSTWTIDDKNVAPTVEKEVSKTENGAYGDKSTASIGDTVYFKTTIAAKKGARNYVLHDTMSAGLTFNKNSIVVKKEGSTTPFEKDSDYKLVTNPTSMGDSCTFHIEFEELFYNSITTDTNIIVTYSATLNEKAEIGSTTGNTNTTYLKYGNKSETVKKTTTTYTFEVPVFKYTKDTSGTETGRADAEFTISKQNDGSDPINLVDITSAATTTTTTDKTYRVETGTPAGVSTITTIITPNSGKFTIKGLAAGTYYLTETKAPAGYNKLTSPVEIVIEENGTITVGTENITSTNPVKVLNKSGSLLPHTGGMGTTLFYIFGAILVVGSGVVLITKKRMK